MAHFHFEGRNVHESGADKARKNASHKRKKVRSGTVILVLSIIVGTLGLLFLPVAALQYSRGSVAKEVQNVGFDRELFALMADTNVLARGEQIAVEMTKIGLMEQTLKAQLLYVSCFENVEISDFAEYALLFSETDNSMLIAALNEKYGLNIDYEAFMRSYVWVLNQTVNPYFFSNTDTKNSDDLAAWARNAYLSGWAFSDGAHGEKDDGFGCQATDSCGLIQGYLQYDARERRLGEGSSTVNFTAQGALDTMPHSEGIVLFDGRSYGVYVGGAVAFASEERGCVVMEKVLDGAWTAWGTVGGIEYPQEVLETIAAHHALVTTE